jgi:hypothetical protein
MRRTLLFFIGLVSVSAVQAQAGGETCGSATVIGSLPFTGTGSTVSAVNDYNYVCPATSGQNGGRDHVYRYTTGGTAEYVTFTMCTGTSNYDSRMYIYQGTCTGTPIACSEDECDNSPTYTDPYLSRITNQLLNASTTYYIIIDGYDGTSNGNYTLNVTAGVAPVILIPFTDMTSSLTTSTFHSGNAVGVVDMNNDKLDDIVRASNNTTMYINYQQGGGTFTESSYPNAIGDPWGMCVGDANNDGMNDVIWGDVSDVYLLTRSGASYTNTVLNNVTGSGSIFVQGLNMFDVNNDGDIDGFICNDVAMAHIYVNGGGGSWTMNQSLMPLATVPASDNSGNYASIWSDVNNDLKPDLYITHCRQFVGSSSDPRRINQLFLNNGNYTYTQDVTNASNLRIGAQSWSTDFADIDNDGDMDAFVLNYDVESQLLLNNGSGVFTNIIAGSGISGTASFFGMNCTFKDFNNDGFVDLFISGTEHRMYVNNGNNTFTLDDNAFVYSNNQILSQGCGDLNHDGFIDIYASYADVYNDPSTRNDKLWMNDAANGNDYIVFNLEGATSNKNGVGAIIKIYGPWGVQVREIRSGEAYGVQNTMAAHFGLGTATSVDSVIIYWPSGTIDQMNNLSSNQFITVVEGAHPQSITEHIIAAQVKVFPNPTQGDLTFDIRNISLSKVTIVIRDISGRLVHQVSGIPVSLYKIDISKLEKGVYTYQVLDNGTPVAGGQVVRN